MNEYIKRLQAQLFANPLILQYLFDRGLTEQTIREFGIGFALDKEHETKQLTLNHDHTEKHLEYGNLGYHKENVVATFTNRIMIPIHDSKGKPVGFTGRTIQGINNKYLTPYLQGWNNYLTQNDISLAKYKNTKETIHFKKGDILFNSHRVQSKYTWIVEAQLSSIGVYQTVNKNVMAIGGRILTDTHIEYLLEHGIKYVCQALDNDNAGLSAMYINAKKLANANITNKVVIFREKFDPMDYIASNLQDELYQILTNPHEGIDYMVRYFNQEYANKSKFKYLLEVKKFFETVNVGHTLIENPEPQTLGWFINRHIGGQK